jgi:hypothetical protein
MSACSSAPEVAPAGAAKPVATTKPAVKIKANPNAGRITACSITSRADAEAAASEPMQQPEGDYTTCTVKSVKDTGAFFAYEVMWSEGAPAMRAAAAGMGAKPVANLGDAAVLQPVMLHVQRGDVYLMFDTQGATDRQVIAFAKKVVAAIDHR